MTKPNKTIAWNVDTQYDFMRPDGLLPVKDAHTIEPALEALTALWKARNIQVVNTADWHTRADAEISDTPDYKTTYPPHCMAYSAGAAFVPATQPEQQYAIHYNAAEAGRIPVTETRNIVLLKNKFDVFAGNKNTDEVVKILNPARVIVYGVATNVCVDAAVRGLRERGRDVYVVRDAIKELPAEQAHVPLDEILRHWSTLGVKYTSTETVAALLDEVRT